MTRFIALLCLAFTFSFTATAAGGKGEPPADKAAARITGSKTYIHLPNLNAPIPNGFEFSGIISLDAGLDIEDDKKRKYALARLPRLKDALRSAVSGYVSISYQVGTVPDLNMMGARLQRAVDRELGPGVAKVTIAAAMITAND